MSTTVKRISIFCIISCLVFSLATCFAATQSGEELFVDALEENITADNMWGAVIPLVGIISFVFIFAFAYRIIKKVLKKGSQGKFGM